MKLPSTMSHPYSELHVQDEGPLTQEEQGTSSVLLLNRMHSLGVWGEDGEYQVKLEHDDVFKQLF